jgi:hypothetical protein
MPHKDPEQKRAYYRAYHKAHKAVLQARVIESHRLARHKRYALIKEIKESSPCTDCGLKFPYYVMDFDHRDRATKVKDISALVKQPYFPWDKVQAEITKCDLVCVNCHRLRTYQGNNSYTTRRYEWHRAILDRLKSTTPCFDCEGIFKPCQMDFDHFGGETKKANVAQLMSHPTAALLKEMVKCHLVCANCHRIRSNGGGRADLSEHSAYLTQKFQEIAATVAYSGDQRLVPFPLPELLGVLPDKELAMRTGVAKDMVAWHRRRAGIVMNRQGERIQS